MNAPHKHIRGVEGVSRFSINLGPVTANPKLRAAKALCGAWRSRLYKLELPTGRLARWDCCQVQ